MKKQDANKTKRNLVINRERVRDLTPVSEDKLRVVVGGGGGGATSGYWPTSEPTLN